MQDLAAGRYRLKWEDDVQITDGTGCGLPPPRAKFGRAAE
jgi:formamidase